MAKKQAAEGQVKARVLVDCHLGKVDEVVALEAAEVAQCAGLVDADPAAVAYAESLKKDAA